MEAEGCDRVVHVRLDGADPGFAVAERLLAAGRPVVVTLAADAEPDVGTVGALARLVLAARRGGAPVRIQAPDAALRGLADLMGLGDVLGVPATAGDPPGRPAADVSGEAQR